MHTFAEKTDPVSILILSKRKEHGGSNSGGKIYMERKRRDCALVNYNSTEWPH